MDDIELVELEQRLRRSAAGHRPQAPAALVSFIDTVPVGSRAGRGAVLMRAGSRTRRGFLAIATAAALILAVVTALTFVSLRNGQFGAGPNGSSGAGWSWQRADGTVVQWVYRVANGYLGVCGAHGNDALCSSPDGLKWTAPADPSIVAVGGGGKFLPDSIARHGGIYVALGLPTDTATTATPTPIVAPSDGSTAASGQEHTLWRSTDGITWAQVASPQFAGLSLTGIGALADGFILVAASTPNETGWALTSADGATWTRSSRLPAMPGMSAPGANVFVIAQGPTPQEWTTTDGATWTEMTLPSGFSFVENVQPLPGGGFMAVGVERDSTQSMLLRSDDGVNWQVVPSGAAGTLLAILRFGDLLIASAVPGSLAEAGLSDLRIWQSQDWGLTWQPLIGPDGGQLSGWGTPLGNGLAIESPDAQTQSRLTLVGTWSGPRSPTTPQPLHSVAAASTGGTVSPTSAPAAQASDQAGGSPCDNVATPSGGPIPAAGTTPAWFPALNPNVGGLSGWSVIGGVWGGDGYACELGSLVVGRSGLEMNSAVAVLAACDTGQIMHVTLLELTGGDARRVVGSFQVTCPISLSSPQVVFTALDDTMAGHALEVYVSSPVPVKGTYAFMIQTTKGPQAAGTTTTP
jgi:hypothetical protein